MNISSEVPATWDHTMSQCGWLRCEAPRRLKSFFCAAALLLTPHAAPAAEETVGPALGTLVVVGGGDRDNGIFKHFIELAGGTEARLVVVPTAASSRPDHDYQQHRAAQYARQELKMTRVTVLHTHDRDEADSESFVQPLRDADAVWFTGGRQWRIADAYLGTLTEQALQGVLDRGGVIGGSSAGASIQGSFLVRGDTSGSEILIGDHQRGLGYIRNSAIDQHLIARNREQGLIEVLTDPGGKMDPAIDRQALLGIGIDEGAGIVVRRNEFEVVGKEDGVVLMYDPATWTADTADCNKYLTLCRGGKYNLKDRIVLDSGTPPHPPNVSATAWAIADGKTGKFLWGSNEEEQLKAASTTKIMCALTVLEIAADAPEVLEETLTFSELADSTGGSTSGIRAGESLTVAECLYGLMLPSGNDAGNALAEHFNDRCAPSEAALPETITEQDRVIDYTSRRNFVSRMNRRARELGMSATHYWLPYGDQGMPGRTTTARDLLKLAFAAMQNATFRAYVATREHETTVMTPEGESRTVRWKNTNKLLPLGGYDGIKTGTNREAGACLVSSGRRGDDHLLVVVLGSTSRDGRYVDSKDVYRWGWLRRSHEATLAHAGSSN